MNIYAIRDAVADTYLYPLMCEKSDQVAIRSFQIAMKSEGTLLYAQPEDFTLLRIGSIDDSGMLVPEMPVILTQGKGGAIIV